MIFGAEGIDKANDGVRLFVRQERMQRQGEYLGCKAFGLREMLVGKGRKSLLLVNGVGIVDEAFHTFAAQVGLEGIAVGREDGIDVVNAR